MFLLSFFWLSWFSIGGLFLLTTLIISEVISSKSLSSNRSSVPKCHSFIILLISSLSSEQDDDDDDDDDDDVNTTWFKKDRIYLIVSIVDEYCNYMINEINDNLKLIFIYILLF